jgi:hypothetical protein
MGGEGSAQQHLNRGEEKMGTAGPAQARGRGIRGRGPGEDPGEAKGIEWSGWPVGLSHSAGGLNRINRAKSIQTNLNLHQTHPNFILSK